MLKAGDFVERRGSLALLTRHLSNFHTVVDVQLAIAKPVRGATWRARALDRELALEA